MGRLNPPGRTAKQKTAPVSRKQNAERGITKSGSNNKDRRMGKNASDSKGKNNNELDFLEAEPVPVEATTLPEQVAEDTTRPKDPFSFAITAGLKPNQVQAAVALAMGSSRAEVAAQAGITIQTLDKWKRENFIFRAFLTKLNADAMEGVRTEAIGIMHRHLLGKKPSGLHEQSTKDIFDWVKLALSTGDGGGNTGRGVSVQNQPSVLHQHVHFEAPAEGGSGSAADDAILLNLQMASKALSGDKKRKLAELLRGQ